MNITVTFRHVDTSDAIRRHAEDKLAKLQKFLRQPMTARVTVSLDKLRHEAEVRISSGGEHYEAHEATDDMYASIDRVLEKLERQIRGQKGALQAKKRRGKSSLRVAEGATPVLPVTTEPKPSKPARRAKRTSSTPGSARTKG